MLRLRLRPSLALRAALPLSAGPPPWAPVSPPSGSAGRCRCPPFGRLALRAVPAVGSGCALALSACLGIAQHGDIPVRGNKPYPLGTACLVRAISPNGGFGAKSPSAILCGVLLSLAARQMTVWCNSPACGRCTKQKSSGFAAHVLRTRRCALRPAQTNSLPAGHSNSAALACCISFSLTQKFDAAGHNPHFQNTANFHLDITNQVCYNSKGVLQKLQGGTPKTAKGGLQFLQPYLYKI